MRAAKIRNVLFLCTGNSARSILAEALLNAMGEGRFRAFSAGSRPQGAVNPFALELIEANSLPTARLRSKSWDEFAAPGAPRMDFIVTVCDDAAGETCPVWPGWPVAAHWGIPDPARAGGDAAAKRAAFLATYCQLSDRISRLVALPLAGLDLNALRRRLIEIHAP